MVLMTMRNNTVYEILPGDFTKLGVTHIGKNTNFAVAVAGTGYVTLKLYKNPGDLEPEMNFELGEGYRNGEIFAVLIKGFTGQGYTYAYEAGGVTFPDPYSKLLSGREDFGKTGLPGVDSTVRGYVVANSYKFKNSKPGYGFDELIIYKLGVRSFTMSGTSKFKGTFKGLTEKLPYFKKLGINCVLLMPAMEYDEVMEETLNEQIPIGVIKEPEITVKNNLWGYAQEYFYFAPKASLAYEPARADYELKTMVDKLHASGIEVMMEFYVPPSANRFMVHEALRFWAGEYNIDGFMLNSDGIDFKLLAGDPYLANVKLLGNGWYDMHGGCDNTDKKRFASYNYDYSYNMKKFLKGDEDMAGCALSCLTWKDERLGGVNFITDHNGFTLADLYMYDMKHNLANGENGCDGCDDNQSWNCGVEGPTRSLKIKGLRLKMRKNAMAALLLSQNTPMIYAGDEFGNSQSGNNNAYCQDNETGWVTEGNTKADKELFEFVRKLIGLRKAHPVLKNPSPYKQTDYKSCGKPDMSLHSVKAWFPDYDYYNRRVAVMYSGEYSVNEAGKRDDDFYLAFNMHWEEKEFEIPVADEGRQWILELSGDKSMSNMEGEFITGQMIKLPGRTIVVLRSVPV